MHLEAAKNSIELKRGSAKQGANVAHSVESNTHTHTHTPKNFLLVKTLGSCEVARLAEPASKRREGKPRKEGGYRRMDRVERKRGVFVNSLV